MATIIMGGTKVDREDAEDIVNMYGSITESFCIQVKQGDQKRWSCPYFWEAANFLMQSYDYGFSII